jgi:hypothetical protein
VKTPVPKRGRARMAHHLGHVWHSARGDDLNPPLGWRRRLWHLLLITLGWGLFVWSWHRVTLNRPDIGELRVLMLAAVLVVPVLTVSWVAHNVGIYRRKGPRKAVPAVALNFDVDFNGRRIVADWPTLLQARRIDIVLDGERKRFVAASSASLPRPPGGEAPDPLAHRPLMPDEVGAK